MAVTKMTLGREGEKNLLLALLLAILRRKRFPSPWRQVKLKYEETAGTLSCTTHEASPPSASSANGPLHQMLLSYKELPQRTLHILPAQGEPATVTVSKSELSLVSNFLTS